MTDFDPIHTVYNHLSGRQPVALMVSDCPTAVFLHRAGNRVTTWIVPSSQPTMIVHLPNLVFHGWCCLLVLTGSVQHFFPPPPPFQNIWTHTLVYFLLHTIDIICPLGAFSWNLSTFATLPFQTPDDWQRNLAAMVANPPRQHPKSNKKNIICLGDTLSKFHIMVQVV